MRRPTSDRGAGLIGAIGGVVVFLTLLTFAVQLLFNLYAASAVTAVAHDTARAAAGGLVDHHGADLAQVLADAEADARRALGRYGDRLEFTWDLDGDRVRLTIGAEHPRVAISAVSGAFGFNRVDRTVQVRIEDVR